MECKYESDNDTIFTNHIRIEPKWNVNVGIYVASSGDNVLE